MKNVAFFGAGLFWLSLEVT